MKIISWNVNGIRAIMKKDFKSSVQAFKADALCFQETKASTEQVRAVMELIDGYEVYANASKQKKGYSGTAVLTRHTPVKTTFDMGIAEHDQEGRTITVEYEHFFLVNTYVPNSGQGLVRLEYRKQWDEDFYSHLKNLEKRKPVVLCGDLNVAHQPIDIARPKANYNKTAGYTQAEIDGFSRLVEEGGFVDVFRMQHPDEVAYTWWSFRANARAKNIGWRIDYFLVSDVLKERVKKAFVLPQYMGSDHCPLGIDIDI